MTTYPYEIHITVRNADIPSFKRFCANNGLKPIVLDLQDRTGTTVIQDVMTSERFYGEADPASILMHRSAFIHSTNTAKKLRDAGYEVVRQKVETAPWHPLAPDTARNGASKLDEYYECHIAVSLTPDRMDELRNLSEILGVHMSRNIFKAYEETVTILLTHRDYSTYREEFTKQILNIVAALKASEFEVDKTEIEYCLWDSNNSHDKAWLEATNSSSL
jgi:hypothetical protein